MLKQKTKIIEINGVSYQLNKMDARTGSYIAFKVSGVLNTAVNGDSEAIGAAVMGMPRREFDELQTLLLKTVNRLVEAPNGQQIPEPVLTVRGDFVDEALAYDPATVIQLTIQALVFNVGDFFGAAGLSIPALD